MIKTAKIVEIEFIKFHGTSLSKEEWIFGKVFQNVKAAMGRNFVIPEKVEQHLIPTRTYFRLGETNRSAELRSRKKKEFTEIRNFYKK